MAEAVSGLQYRSVVLQSLDEGNAFDISNAVLSVDYFEDILEPCVTMTMQITNAYGLFNGLPIRGGERLFLEAETASGEFAVDQMYVYKVSGLEAEKTAENFTLHLVSREFLTNETARCATKYSGKVNQTVTKILKEDLKTTNFKSENIEETSNTFSFIGNMKKPLHVLQWLGPKSISTATKKTGTDGKDKTEQGLAKGTAGFLFYENKDGFNFRSIDKIVTKTESKYSYKYNGKVIEAGNIENNFSILNYFFEKNIDLRKALRVGMYANKTYFYNRENHTFSIYNYYLQDEIKNASQLGNQESIAVSEGLGKSFSRIMVRTSDHGILAPAGGTAQSGRDISDQAKAYSRYNLLFTQALNILIPCNINLKVGDIIYCEFPEMNSGKTREVDSETSGNYVIRELRHHFSAQQNTTSLKLMRDSYGLYGPNQ